MSSRFFEYVMAGFWIGVAGWAWLFDWFTTYLTELGEYAGHEWALALVFGGLGGFQAWAAYARHFGARCACAVVGACLFLILGIFMTEARTISGLHAFALPYMAAVHLIVLVRLISRG